MGGGEPSGPLADAIKRDFGSFESFKEKLTNSAVSIQGSGWGWLGYEPSSGKLRIATCANQDPLDGTTGTQLFNHFICMVYFNILLLIRSQTTVGY